MNNVRFVRPHILKSARSLSVRYGAAEPFPHVVIDDLLEEADYRLLSDTFPAPSADIWHQYQGGRENRKLQSRTLNDLPPAHRNLIDELNSVGFVSWLQDLTGILPLAADPEMSGGGLHQSLPGGHLAIHVDYNRHRRTGQFRRLNVILYLNDDWREEWGGHLELWTPNMDRCAQHIAPKGNRLVVFSTSEASWHGHPEPLACPSGITRKSVAFYYYSPVAAEVAPDHSTVFRERPGEVFRRTPKERARDMAIRLGMRRSA